MAEPALVVELRGRLGNQLFQFAAGYAQSRRAGCALRFTNRKLKQGETLELPRLIGDRYQRVSKREMLALGRFQYEIPGRPTLDLAAQAFAKARARVTDHRVMYDTRGSNQVVPAVFDARPPCLFQGWFEDEEYFSEFADEIAVALTFPAVDDVFPPDLRGPLVAVSFRRGDYVSLQENLPLAYYDAAVEQLRERTEIGTFLVFGDDVDFVELVGERLARHAPVVSALQLSLDPVVNLAMYARCDHALIANSTFAWWGGWLAERRAPDLRSIVMVPARWRQSDGSFHPAPARWTRIEW